MQDPWTMERNCELFFDLVLSGELKVSEVITHRFGWEGAPGVYEMLTEERGRTGLVVLDWRDDGYGERR